MSTPPTKELRKMLRKKPASVRHNESDDPMRPPPGTPWFTAVRTEDARELMKLNHKAFCLLYIIASRARYAEGFNQHGLVQGEAMIGKYDLERWGFTLQNYRTAKRQLEKAGFVTLKVTPLGTVARLADTRVFALLPPLPNTQSNTQPTPLQHLQEEGKKGKKGKRDDKDQRGALVPPAFEQPGEEAVHDYGARRGYDSTAIETFYGKHSVNNWMVRGEPIRDWRKLLDGWMAKVWQ